MHKQLQLAIQKTLNPLVEQIFDKFKIGEDDLGVREAFKSGDLRTSLLTKYGDHKDKEWNKKITEEQIELLDGLINMLDDILECAKWK